MGCVSSSAANGPLDGPGASRVPSNRSSKCSSRLHCSGSTVVPDTRDIRGKHEPGTAEEGQCDNDSCDSDDDLGLGFPGGLEASSLGTSAATLSSRGHSGRGIDEDSLREFTTQELREATSGFSRILGEGGFGHVFHGRLALHPGSPPVDVAVKVQKTESQQGLKELQAEVRFLGDLKHPNLVNLYGFCCDGEDWMLVYEYVPNRSVDYHLFPCIPDYVLGFKERMRIALGAAQGLAYLHQGAHQPVVLRDFKTPNILVDRDFHAKLTDFGLAREGPRGSRTHESTDNVVGTSGYLAPEYMTRGHVSERCDVFSFGVVLLELLTGLQASAVPEKKPENEAPERKPEYMKDWAVRIARGSRDGWKLIMDPRLGGAYSPQAARITVKAAVQCVSDDPKCRPPMACIVDTLKVVYHQACTGTS